MRKDGLVEAVASDKFALIARKRELYIEQVARNFLGAASNCRITETAQTEVRATEAFLVETKVVEVDLDAYAEIDCGKTLERRQSMESHFRILLPIHSDDVLAAPTQEFIDAEVFDVAAIGEIQPRQPFVHGAKHFLYETDKPWRAPEQP